MSMQGVENTEDALISIIKSIKKEMKDDIMKKQFEASTASISNETSSIASNEVDKDDNHTSTTASCLLPKELSSGSFLFPFYIDDHSLYAITTLEAKDNIMPLDVYKYLGLDKFGDACTVENTIGNNDPLGTVDILCVKKIYMVDTGQEEETFDPLEIGMDLFSYESLACLEFEQRTRSYGTPNLQDEIVEPISFLPDKRGLVKRWHVCKPIHVTYDDGNGEYCRMWLTCDPDSKFCIGYNEVFRGDCDPYSRRFDEYNRVFKNEIEHLSNEYILRMGKKGYVLDDVWEKCQQNYKKTNEAWHDEEYEEDEMWRIGDEKTDYDPPYVNIETFKVKKYSFKGERSFICITDREDKALPLGRVNGARFKAMIRKELEGHKNVHKVT
ncbi:hypothetical protein Tco_0404413 [Tanacetum coccineum]